MKTLKIQKSEEPDETGRKSQTQQHDDLEVVKESALTRKWWKEYDG